MVDNDTYIATAEQTEVVLGLLAPLIQGKTKAFKMVTRYGLKNAMYCAISI